MMLIRRGILTAIVILAFSMSNVESLGSFEYIYDETLWEELKDMKDHTFKEWSFFVEVRESN